MITKFPRLLVATEFPPNASGGGAAVVRQMLKDWPVDRLFWWSPLPDNDPMFWPTGGGALHCYHSAQIISPSPLVSHKIMVAGTFLEPLGCSPFPQDTVVIQTGCHLGDSSCLGHSSDRGDFIIGRHRVPYHRAGLSRLYRLGKTVWACPSPQNGGGLGAFVFKGNDP